ncbi:MAG: hypothetical protein IPJ77_23970 [Planctomycetes bacterium]|nr:hypothetical protein [Planctomycetota bacterium]
MTFAACLTVLLLALPAPSQSTTSAVTTESSVRIVPFSVGTERVTAEMQQLWLVYGPFRQHLEEAKLARVIGRELDRRADVQAERRLAGRSGPAPSGDERVALLRSLRAEELERLRQHAFDVEGEVELAVQRALDDFRVRAPGLDAEVEMRRSYRGADGFRSQLRWASVFDRVFLPADDEQRPEVTVAALRARFGDQYETWRKPWKLSDGSVDPQYQEMTRQIVRDHLYSGERFRTSLEGPDFGIALAAEPEGAPRWTLSTEDAWRTIAPRVDAADVELARRYWTTVVATQKELASKGLVLDREARERALGELSKQLQEFVPSLEAFAVQQQRFPSPETFFEYYALTCGYQKEHTRKMAGATPEKPAPALLEHVAKANARHGGVLADAEVLLVSAWDFANARWRPGGFDAARARADELMARVRANELAWKEKRADARDPAALWSALLDERSEWWDPPPLPGMPVDPSVRTKNRGRFGALDYQGLSSTSRARATTCGRTVRSSSTPSSSTSSPARSAAPTHSATATRSCGS